MENIRKRTNPIFREVVRRVAGELLDVVADEFDGPVPIRAAAVNRRRNITDDRAKVRGSGFFRRRHGSPSMPYRAARSITIDTK
jgi:hypothetical protein